MQSPFAQLALSYALQPGVSILFSEFYHMLNFSIKPIQEKLHGKEIREALGLLAILAIRHQDSYQRSDEIDWGQDFQTDTEFFERITTMDLIEVADMLTDNDYIEFDQLSPLDAVDYGHHLQLLYQRWNHLCERVKECVIFDKRLALRIMELAQVSLTCSPSIRVAELWKHLYTLSNFYSLLALLLGLRAANYIETSFLFQLSDSENGYAAYLEEFALRGGLPFLILHFLKYQINRQKGVQEIFAFATRPRVPPLRRCVTRLSSPTGAENIEEQVDPSSWRKYGAWVLTAFAPCFCGL